MKFVFLTFIAIWIPVFSSMDRNQEEERDRYKKSLRASAFPAITSEKEGHTKVRDLSTAALSTLFEPNTTGSIKNYGQAITFCASKGLTLASKSDYCSTGVPFAGTKSGDQWSPIADYPNGWLQVGDTTFHTVCHTHRENTNVDPQWGLDSHKQPWEANYVLCKEKPVQMFEAPATDAIKTYQEAVTFCASKGLTLASKSDYCSTGVPFAGTKSGDQWSPIADYPNGWLQVGDTTFHTVCHTHRENTNVDPQWGLDSHKQPWEANYVLCKEKPVQMFEAPATDAIKTYQEAVTFCASKGLTLASKSDYCSTGVPFAGTKSGDQWSPIADYPNGWLQVGDTTFHTVCHTHRESTNVDPQWGLDSDKKPWEANYVLCSGLNRPPTNQAIFQQCSDPYTQKGIIPDVLAPIAKCYDFVGSSVDLIEHMVIQMINDIPEGNEAVDQAIDAVYKPLQQVVSKLRPIIIAMVEKATGFSAKVCAGDFQAQTIINPAPADDMVPLCSKLPLDTRNDAEWSTFAFEFSLPTPISGAVCEGLTTNVKMSGCLATSFCDVLPSVAFAVDSGVFSCLLAQTGVETSGIGTALSYALELGMDHIAWGVSLTNAYTIPIPIFNGHKVIDYSANPTVFDRVSISLKSEKFHKTLKGWFILSGTMTRGLSINSPTGDPASEAAITAGITSFNASETDSGGDAMDQYSEWVVQGVVKGDLQLDMLMSKVPKVGKLIGDITFALPSTSFFVSTGQQTIILPGGQSETVYAGVSTFIGSSSDQAGARQMIDFFVKKLSGIINPIMKGLGVLGANVDAIISSLKLDDLDKEPYYGVGLTINENRMGFVVNVPLSIPEIGSFALNCHTDYDKFDCSITINENISKIFKIAAQQVQEGLLWIAREIGGSSEVLSAALEKIGTVDIFSPENVHQTAQDLEAILGTAIDDTWDSFRNEVLGLCTADTSDCWGPGTPCVEGLSCCDCCEENPSTWWPGPQQFRCGNEPCWGDDTLCIGETCKKCCSGSHYWVGLSQYCGSKPCWSDGTLCVNGISCEQCCNSNEGSGLCGNCFYVFGFLVCP